jgi:hypothetical protein
VVIVAGIALELDAAAADGLIEASLSLRRSMLSGKRRRPRPRIVEKSHQAQLIDQVGRH